jgi:hypothetical protein
MFKKFFTIARSDKKSRKKALHQLDEHEGRIDASEVLGGRQDDTDVNGSWVKDGASTEFNSIFQDPNDIF